MRYIVEAGKEEVCNVTKLGIALRKIRLDRQELLKNMADKLKVSSAFLSAVETGKKRLLCSAKRQCRLQKH